MRSPIHSITVTLLLVIITSASPAGQSQWPQFRGPNAGEIADDPALPDTWVLARP